MGGSSKNNPDSATCEHIVPLDDGGQHAISNIEIICGACQSANNSVKQYYKIQGRIVPSEYWTLSLDMLSFGPLVERFYSQYHGIFLEKRARFN